MKTVKCVACEKELELDEDCNPVERTSDGKLCVNIVYDGVDCVAHGNYGSSVFDPMGRTPLLGFVLCDDCFKSKRHLMHEIVASQER
jgi:hypothetical protein